METEKAKSQNDNNKLRYYMLKCGSINIIDEAKEIWTKLFGDTNFNMLYDYYINLRKSNKIILNEHVCMNIIQKYKQFILDLDFFSKTNEQNKKSTHTFSNLARRYCNVYARDLFD